MSLLFRVSGIFLLVAALHLPTAHSEDILNTAATSFVEAEDRFKRVGIEMEMSGLSFEQLEPILKKYFDVSEVTRPSKLETHLKIPEGTIKLKIEGDAWRFEGDDAKYAAQIKQDILHAPREIVFPPLTYQRTSVLQALSNDLEKAGAIGTTANHAVAFQVNYEFGALRDDPRRVRDLVDVMRTYYDAENMKQIDNELHVPAKRREFLNDITPGFRKKLFNPAYTPDLEEFFTDYIYRQSAELFGYKNAWSASLPELQKFMAKLEDPVHPTVIKMQRVRVSSLLLEAFPNDPLVKTIVASRWAVPAPIIEFREFNMVFGNVDRDIRASLGLVNSVRKYGYYRHDRLMSALTGVPESDFPRLRRKEAEGVPFVVRYLLEDPKVNKLSAADRAVPGSKALWLQLSPDHPGRTPLHIGGESIVFNRRHIHRTTVLGQYNPGLDHGYIQQVLENKVTEAKLFGAYAPGSMPRYKTLGDLPEVSKSLTPESVFKAANAEFKKGWVMKSAWDLGSEKFFISNKTDLAKSLEAYRNGFEAYREKIEKQVAGMDPEVLIFELKKHPGYLGWKIQSMLEKPDQVFFQEMIPIDREFRVEALNGKVIRGATIDRYAYMNRKAKPPSTSEVHAIEEFTQAVLDRLPAEMKVLPYGFDIARLKTGGFSVIETNPGGNSSFLEESVASVKAFEKALLDYRAEAQAGRLKRMSAQEEMAWLKKQFSEFKISPKKSYPGMLFTSMGIFDPDYRPLHPDCSALFQASRYIPF
jgi:hypothetical protein